MWLNLHHWSQRVAIRRAWLKRFRNFKVKKLNWHEFCREKMVYVCLHVGVQSGTRFQLSSGNCYVGSTMQSIFQRRNTRIRKFNQLQANKLVKCELAIRYWQACNNFYAYVMIPWKHFAKGSQLHVNEVLLIDQIQPSLNYPFVSELIFAAGKVPKKNKTPPLSSLQTHNKLRQKLRIRLRKHPGQWYLNRAPSQPTKAWQLLYDLSSITRDQLHAWRKLRSPEINSTQLLFLVRLAATAEAHIKFKALHHLYKEMKRRNMAKPRNKRPLTIPFLAHRAFEQNLKQWLTNTIIRHKHHATEFHVPSTKVCCKSSQTVAETLYNMNSFLKIWSIKPPTSCNCYQFLQQHPECRTTAHHVASPLSALNLPHQLAKCLAYSANSQIYFGYQKYTEITTELVQKWLNHHNLQNIDISNWQQFRAPLFFDPPPFFFNPPFFFLTPQPCFFDPPFF